jgi:ketosteroid isomerase-like protein
MSQANVEIVKRAWERDATGGWRHPELFAPDLVYRPVAAYPESREYRGFDEYRGFYDGFMEAWSEDFTASPVTFREHGDVVITRVEFTGHARASRVEIFERIFKVFWLRNGLITRIEDFVDRADALGAAGLAG